MESRRAAAAMDRMKHAACGGALPWQQARPTDLALVPAGCAPSPPPPSRNAVKIDGTTRSKVPQTCLQAQATHSLLRGGDCPTCSSLSATLGALTVVEPTEAAAEADDRPLPGLRAVVAEVHRSTHPTLPRQRHAARPV